MKSEPLTYGIDHLTIEPEQSDYWDGIRNYQVRNLIRDDIKVGDLAFFYHSNCKVPGIVGTMKIIKEAYPDDTQFDPNSKYYDPKSSPDNPRWLRVDVQLIEKFDEIISLQQLRKNPELDGMVLLKKGNRLSISPVSEDQWDIILLMQGSILI